MDMKMMTFRMLVAVLLLGMADGSFAQLTKEQQKYVRKETKRLVRDGWQPAPGGLPVGQQLEKAFLMQVSCDADLMPRYLMGEGVSASNDYATAKMQSTELAKHDLASQMQSEVAVIIDQMVSNRQTGAMEAETVSQMVMTARNQVSQSLGRTIPVLELHRAAPNGGEEVLVRLAYRSEDLRNKVEQLFK